MGKLTGSSEEKERKEERVSKHGASELAPTSHSKHGASELAPTSYGATELAPISHGSNGNSM